jgi:hypothetical protein
MLSTLSILWETRPLRVIIALTLLTRLLAAFFSPGYGMFDDHFLIIESPWDHARVGKPWFGVHEHTTRIYTLIHFLFHDLALRVDLQDPQIRMLIIRIAHAFYSVLVVYFAYRITEKITTQATAKKVGLVLALFWLMPFMSVRNLVEMAAIPPILAAFNELYKTDNQPRRALWAGVLLSLAFVIRYQVILLVGGVGLALLFQRDLKRAILVGVGALVGSFLFQGMWDWILFGFPFKDFVGYLSYNATHSTDYTTGPWYVYLLLLIGILIPPTSLLLIGGFFNTWKKYLLLFLPTIIFFLFHSYFPNKQERFILTIVPLIIMLAIIGYDEWMAKESRVWIQKTGIALWIWFWIFNTILFGLFTFNYSKKTRVESLYYLSKKERITGIVLNGGRQSIPHMPIYYLNKNVPLYTISSADSSETARIRRELAPLTDKFPNYVILLGDENLKERAAQVAEQLQRKLFFEKEITPSLLDDVFYYLNPKFNLNQTGFIYRVE